MEVKTWFRRRASAVLNLIQELSLAGARRLNQTFELSSANQLSSTSSAALQDSSAAVIQTSCFCRVELNS